MGFAGEPYLPPPPSPARAHPTGHFPAWLMASAFAFPRQLGEKRKCFSPFPSEIFIYRDFKYLSKAQGSSGDVGMRQPGPPAQPSSPSGHLLLFIYFLEDLPCSKSLLAGLFRG